MGLAYVLFFLAALGIIASIVFGFLVGGFEGVFAAFVGSVMSALLLGGLGYRTGHTNYNERTIQCTVTEKDRGGDDGSYRVYTRECGVLANYDSMVWHGKTNSADMWNQIKTGETYTFRVVGWRFEPLSDFPNILKVG